MRAHDLREYVERWYHQAFHAQGQAAGSQCWPEDNGEALVETLKLIDEEIDREEGKCCQVVEVPGREVPIRDQRCENCRFYCAGYCMRFPETEDKNSTQWCGEWKAS